MSGTFTVAPSALISSSCLSTELRTRFLLNSADSAAASIAGVASPLFFGWIYSVSVGEGGAQAAAWLSEGGLPAVSAAAYALLSEPGLAFYLASAVLALGALIGFRTARRAERDEVTSV